MPCIFYVFHSGVEANPFGDPDPDWNGQEDTSQDNKMTDDGRPGVPVRALYDYDATDTDEISFKCGKSAPGFKTSSRCKLGLRHKLKC